MKKQTFLEKARDVHGYKYEYINLPDKILYNDYIELLYKGVKYKQRVVKHIMLGRCPEKDMILKTNEQFILESKKIWGDKYDYSLVDYKGSLKRVKIIYDGVIYEQMASGHLKGYAPEHMNKEIFLKKAKEKWGGKYDYSLVDYINAGKKVKILYNGIEYDQTPRQHLKCQVEKTQYKFGKTTEQFINQANLIHDFKYNYDNTVYVKANSKLIVTCLSHGDFNQRAQDHLNGVGCPTCNDSKGEQEISKILKRSKIKFERQKIFNGCRNILPLPFDFYIESLRVCIEFDGIQHFRSIKFFGGHERFEKLQINDKIKSDYCEDNYIDLIRIRYDQIDEIERILRENLENKIKILREK